MDTPGFSRNKGFFEKKIYHIISSVHDITNKILSRDSHYNINVAI